ncbi:hypothetical protein BH10PSE7_BH10PSE7_03030 [soil metagenome]
MVVLIGGAGAPNLGDELIVRGWLQFLVNDLDYEKDIWLEATSANAAEFHRRFENIRHSTLMQTTVAELKKRDFWHMLRVGWTFLDKGGVKRRGEKNFSHLLNAEIVHLHGGGYMHQSSVKGFYLGFLAALARKFGTRLFATGIGFGPYPKIPDTMRDLLTEVLSYFQTFELRDIEGFRLLRGLSRDSHHMVNGLDDIYMLQRGDLVSDPGDGKRRLFLALFQVSADSYGPDFWEALPNLASQFDEVVCVESVPGRDTSIIEKIHDTLPNVRVFPTAESVYLGMPIGPKDFMIASRFHSHFVGARVGCSGYYLQNTTYYEVKHQSIVDRGSTFAPLPKAQPIEIFRARHSVMARMDNIYYAQKMELARHLYNVDTATPRKRPRPAKPAVAPAVSAQPAAETVS